METYDYEGIDPGYYHEAMYSGKGVQKLWHKEKFQTILNKIPNKKVKVLDIACSAGTLFYLLRKKNKKAQLVGLDLSKSQIAYAKKLVPTARFIREDAAKLKLGAGTYDYITMLEFIEHIDEKTELSILKNCYKLLKKGGKVYITTPNYTSLWPIVEVFWNKWSKLDYSHQHINKKTHFNIRKQFEKAGLKVVSVKTIFVLSPFAALISDKFAEKVFDIESKIFPKIGMTLVIEAVKE